MDIRRGGSYTSHSVGQNSKKVEFKAAAIFHAFIQAAMKWRNSYFIYWNFVSKSCFVCFFSSEKNGKNPQFNFSSQNLSIEHNFFKWDGKVTEIWYLFFHRIRKKWIFIYNFINYFPRFNALLNIIWN